MLAGFCSEQTDLKHPNMKAAQSKKKPKVGPQGEEHSAFDLWLNRGLHKIYDDVAQEPIPDDLLKLIEDSRDGQKN